jgi:hypothetical protein
MLVESAFNEGTNMNRTTTAARTTYGFRHEATGALVRVDVAENGPDSYACGAKRVSLSRAEHLPVFEVADPVQAAIILHADIPWYNSDEDSPSWGEFKPDEVLVPVRFDLVETFDDRYREPVETRRATGDAVLPPVAVMDKISSSRRGIGILTKRYFGVLPPDGVEGIEIAVFGLRRHAHATGLDGAVMLRAGDRIPHGIALKAVELDEEYPIRDADLDRMADGCRPVLVLYDAWRSRPEPIDFAIWPRVAEATPSASPAA